MIRNLSFLGLCLLAGCDNSSAPLRVGTVSPPPAVLPLCVSSDCGEAIPLVDIPDAENLVFSADGRLFVSGGLNVYEITRSGETYSATPIADVECNFTGLAVRAGVLYAACGDSRLFAGRITATPQLTDIYQFTDMCLPNGLALGADGRLYAADLPLSCLVPDPKLVALTLDPADPLRVTAQEVWVQGSPAGLLFAGGDNVLRLPNGLITNGTDFYGTDGGSVYTLTQQGDGTAGEVMPLYFEPTELDDIGFTGNSLLVTDYFGGRIFELSLDGELLQETLPSTFSSPSSARLARPPLFRADDILVTEKGVIGDAGELPVDRLTLFRRSE